MYLKNISNSTLMNTTVESIDMIESSTKCFWNSTNHELMENTISVDNNTADLILPCPVTNKGMLFVDILELPY